MAWTTPTIRSTGDLITASIWNTDIVDNLAYLKGEAGVDIALEEDIIPSAGTEKVGLSTNPWDEGHFDKLYAGPRFSVHKFIRQQVLVWENDTLSNYQIAQATTGGGAVQLGGTGQAVLKADDDAASTAYIANQTEQNNAFDTSFNIGRSPYLKVEFTLNNADPATDIFIGFRTTKTGTARPAAASEKYAGLIWNGSIWVVENGDGAGNSDNGGTETIAANQRHVLEILIVSATQVEYYLDGVLLYTSTTALPTGDVDWQVLIVSDGLGGAGDDSLLTIDESIFQEDLS